jgi:pyrimidine-specific ribonucleoside hydrolase
MAALRPRFPKSVAGLRAFSQHGNTQAPCLLSGLRQDSLPPLSALGGRGQQSFFASIGRERHNLIDPKLRCLLDRPLEAVEFNDRQQKGDSHWSNMHAQAFEQRKFHFIAANALGSREPHGRPIAELINLAGLGAKHATQMVSGFSAENCRFVFKPLDKESPAHVLICYTKPMPYGPRPSSALRYTLIPVFLGAILILFRPIPGITQTPRRAIALPHTVIIDTDAGGDDLMAIAFLLSRPEIHVEAITVVNGEAHVQAGGRNILRLLELAGRRDVPVFLGRDTPLTGNAEFPAEWRRVSDELPGVTLPDPTRVIESQSAPEYLAKRLADAAHPVQVLATGPLTNLAEALTRSPRVARTVRQFVIMGGAVHVPGNLGDGGMMQTNNSTAEWNIFIDPVAAKTVFTSGAPIRLVALDATQRVPIDMAMLEEFQSHAETPLAKFVSQVLETNREMIRQEFYFAWDPLAAVALANPAVVTFRPMAIEISQNPDELGRTVEVKKARANVQVAIDANDLRFREIFMTALGVR